VSLGLIRRGSTSGNVEEIRENDDEIKEENDSNKLILVKVTGEPSCCNEWVTTKSLIMNSLSKETTSRHQL
jgi:hypothetical protein